MLTSALLRSKPVVIEADTSTATFKDRAKNRLCLAAGVLTRPPFDHPAGLSGPLYLIDIDNSPSPPGNGQPLTYSFDLTGA